MQADDIAQVDEIDREAFPTQLPPPNYRHELQNQLARYIVVCERGTAAAAPEAKPKKGLARLAAWLRGRPHRSDPPPADGEPIVGFAGIWVLSDEAHITNIAVRQAHQRRSVGELLLITLFDLAGDLKASFMTLEVRASNTPAQRLYRKYGFVEVGVRRGYYLDNKEDAIIMSTERLTSASFQARLDQLREDLAKKLGQ